MDTNRHSQKTSFLICGLDFSKKQKKQLFFSECEELGEVRAKLLRTEIKLSEVNEENIEMNGQLKEFEITLSQMNIQYQEVRRLLTTSSATCFLDPGFSSSSISNFSNF